jgi:hypothetical protein
MLMAILICSGRLYLTRQSKILKSAPNGHYNLHWAVIPEAASPNFRKSDPNGYYNLQADIPNMTS